MSKELTDVSDRCGSCKFFMYRVIDGTLKKWGGRCTKPNRKTYHDRSQKACKLYEPYNADYLTDESRKELEELDIKVEEDIPTVQAIPVDVLDKIRAEIEDIAFDWQEIDGEHESFMVVDLNDALQIIDKYKAESEDKE